MNPSGPQQLSTGRKLLYSAAVGFAVVALLEGGLWLAGLPSYWQLVQQDESFGADDRRISRRLRQHYQQPGRGRAVPGTSLWLYRPVELEGYTINRLGFRGREPAPGADDELRVAVLGGSAVYGWLVADSKTIPAFLEAELRRRSGDRPVTVLNLGVEGYRFQQELELAERLLPELEPDLLLFYHGANDILVAHGRGFELDRPWSEGEAGPPLVVRYERPSPLWRLRQGVKRSRIVTLGLLLRLRARVPGDPVDLSSPLPPRLLRHRDELVLGYRRRLEAAARLASSSGSRVVVCLQPSVYTKGSLSRLERFRARYAEAAHPRLGAFFLSSVEAMAATAPAGIELYDLGGALAGSPATDYQDWVHLTPKGNRVVAERIADLLER